MIKLETLAAIVSAAMTQSARAQIYNGGPVTIATQGVGAPYPATITVAGGSGSLTGMTLSITGFSHAFPDDIGILLEGPNGNTVVIADGPGSVAQPPAPAIDWVFDDSAASALSTSGTLVSGTFKPGQNQYSDVFPSADLAAQWFTSFGAAFNGFDANGDWKLHVADFVAGDGGSIAGWSLNLVPEPATISLLAFGVVALGRRRK